MQRDDIWHLRHPAVKIERLSVCVVQLVDAEAGWPSCRSQPVAASDGGPFDNVPTVCTVELVPVSACDSASIMGTRYPTASAAQPLSPAGMPVEPQPSVMESPSGKMAALPADTVATARAARSAEQMLMTDTSRCSENSSSFLCDRMIERTFR